MYAEWVTLFDEPGYVVKVWVTCTPDTSAEEKRRRAINALLSRLGIWELSKPFDPQNKDG